MNIESIAAIIFIILLTLILYLERKKLQVHKIAWPLLYFVMYRTKAGLAWMDRVANKFNKTTKFLGTIGIGVGFIGMVIIAAALIDNVWSIFTQPEAAPGVGLVLPFEVKGAFYVPFFYWILSIFIIATVHEAAHGLVARAYKIKVKSTGLAFLGLILPIVPAAFVEPDEKQLTKKPRKQQLAVFAAGPFSNVLLAALVLLITSLVSVPISNHMVEPVGVEITDFVQGDYPAANAGILPGEVIKSINGISTPYLSNFSQILADKNPGDQVQVTTNASSYEIILAQNPDDESKPYLGVFVQQKTDVQDSFKEKFGAFTPKIILWFMGLLYWLYVLNIGIGLFNLVPLGPLDGGRMLLTTLQKYLPDKKAIKYWKNIGLFFLLLILINIFFSFIS